MGKTKEYYISQYGFAEEMALESEMERQREEFFYYNDLKNKNTNNENIE